MVNPIQDALAAVRAHTRKSLVHSHNLANSANDKGHPQTARIEEGPTGAPQARVETSQETQPVEVPQEMAGLMNAQRGFEANLKSLDLMDRSLGKVIDILI